MFQTNSYSTDNTILILILSTSNSPFIAPSSTLFRFAFSAASKAINIGLIVTRIWMDQWFIDEPQSRYTVALKQTKSKSMFPTLAPNGCLIKSLYNKVPQWNTQNWVNDSGDALIFGMNRSPKECSIFSPAWAENPSPIIGKQMKIIISINCEKGRKKDMNRCSQVDCISGSRTYATMRENLKWKLDRSLVRRTWT